MSSNTGLPVGQSAVPVGSAGGSLNPVPWVDADNGAVIQGQIKRGQPAAFSWWMRRPRTGPETVAQGAPYYLHSRGYSRGAGAFAPKFGIIPVNPIGAGVYVPNKLPVIAGPGARYQFGAIFFDVQSVPTSIHFSPTMPQQTVNALLAQSHVGAAYATTG